jgi:hypothetical protein
MNTAKLILSASLLSTGVLAAGCAADVGNEASNDTPTATTAKVGQAVISYDPATSTYRFESGTLDPAGFPYSVEINREVRGTLQTRDDVLEVKGVAAEAEISFLSQSADQRLDPAKQLNPGESVELNACGWVPTHVYQCGTIQYCYTAPAGPGVTVTVCTEPKPIYCVDNYLWMCS